MAENTYQKLKIPICAECGSNDVEIKGFVHQLNGTISYPDQIDQQDTWCLSCEENTGVEFINEEDYNK